MNAVGQAEKVTQNRVISLFCEALGYRYHALIAKWEAVLGVKISRVFVRRMKTKWGSCNPDARSIRLNSELAKKSPECLEYIVVHEMLHLLERGHNDRFKGLLDRYLPNWRICRDQLSQLPLGHENWGDS